MKKFKRGKKMQSYALTNTPRQDETPFIPLIETTAEKRVYTFQTEERPFLISVDLTRDDYGAAFVEVAGQAEPNHLIAAILFVEKNEFRCAETNEMISDLRGYEENFRK